MIDDVSTSDVALRYSAKIAETKPQQNTTKHLPCACYSALSLYCGIFHPKNSEKTPHSLPVRASYRVLFLSS